VIAQDHSIITLVVIVAIVVILAGLALDFGLSCYRAQKVDHLVIQHLSLFVVAVAPQRLDSWTEGELTRHLLKQPVWALPLLLIV